MNNKILSLFTTVALITSIFLIFTIAANTKNINLSYSKNQFITVTLKNEVNIETSKQEISKIPNLKIIKIEYRDKEWSKMVNKMDLPNINNPFKNKFTIKFNKNINKEEIYNKLKKMDFVENIESF